MDGPIVVGTDGSETATKAVMQAVKLAVAFDQPLHIVSAYDPEAIDTKGLPPEFAGMVTSHTHIEGVLDNVGARARRAGAKVELHAVTSNAAEAILDVADQVKADLIVVGNKGIGSTRRFLLGNVPSKVVHHSPCSTFVVQTT